MERSRTVNDRRRAFPCLPIFSHVARGLLAGACLLTPILSGRAQTATAPAFDLAGPTLRISVTRGTDTLPIAQVPGLAEGDKVTAALDIPPDQGVHFLMVSAFLRGATNPPPKKWITTAETWKSKESENRLTLTIPKGARQLVLFVVPETKGAGGTVADAVRNRPGEFVRATQELNQASLDRSRLNAFMAEIRAQGDAHPEQLRTVAPRLARSLSMKLNEDCLSRVVELQASCLLGNASALVLGDMHSSSVAETLAGAPTDLALQISTTKELGFGYYSPYIGVVRDIARIFGAFGNPNLDYLPALGVLQDDSQSMILNRAPSFGKPKSVLVAALPAIDADRPPILRRAVDTPLCATQPDLVLPVDGAPLIYSTAYSRKMLFTLHPPGGESIDLPVAARADSGGYVFTSDRPAALQGSVTGRLHGYWGFRAFDGPEFTLQFPGTDTPALPDGAAPLIVGTDQSVEIDGVVPACIDRITIDQPAPARQRKGKARQKVLEWKTEEDDSITLALPLKDAKAGPLVLDIRYFGVDNPVKVPLTVVDAAAVAPVTGPVPQGGTPGTVQPQIPGPVPAPAVSPATAVVPPTLPAPPPAH